MDNKSAISSDLIRGHIDTIILYSLFEEDKFAQMISDHVKEKSGEQYELNQATLYSSLKRLEALKYIKGYWKYADVGRRRYFSLTDLGRSVVNENLNSWNFSRAIIDKLMDNTPETVIKTETIIKTEYVDRIVTVPAEPTSEQKPTELPVNEEIVENEVKNEEILQENSSTILPEPVLSENSSNVTSSPIIEQQEINFRNILQGLIKVTAIKKEPKTDIDSVSDEEVFKPENQEILDFNETISSTEYGKKNTNSGKIDYGDLILQAAKEGYKLRVSNKELKISEGSLFINKLNLFSSCFIYLLLLIENLIFGFAFKGQISNVLLIVLSVITLVLPIIMLTLFIKKPYKTSKALKPDAIYTSLIIFFNLLLITFAINLLFNVDFNNLAIISSSFILPLAVYIDVVLYFVVRFLFSKTPLFINKKTNK